MGTAGVVGAAGLVFAQSQHPPGRVMSLMTRRDNGIVVTVASNVAHANTAALALKVADVFAEQK